MFVSRERTEKLLPFQTETVKVLQELLEEEISPSRVRSLLDVLRRTQDIGVLRQAFPKLTEGQHQIIIDEFLSGKIDGFAARQASESPAHEITMSQILYRKLDPRLYFQRAEEASPAAPAVKTKGLAAEHETLLYTKSVPSK